MRSLTVLIVALALVGGCGTTERSLSDSIVGNWVTDRYNTHAEFRDDGTYDKGTGVPNRLEWGTWFGVWGRRRVLSGPRGPAGGRSVGGSLCELLGGGGVG